MKLYIYDGPDGIFWSKYPPSAQSPLVLGTIEVQEPETVQSLIDKDRKANRQRDLVVENFNLQSDLVHIDKTLDEIWGKPCMAPRIDRIRELGRRAGMLPKKTVVMEIDKPDRQWNMCPAFGPEFVTQAIFAVPMGSKNIKCTYEPPETPKKTVVKEIPLQLVPPTPRTLDSDGNVRHSIAVGLPPKAFNIKLIYEDEQ
jgi:hypothetical protein